MWIPVWLWLWGIFTIQLVILTVMWTKSICNLSCLAMVLHYWLSLGMVWLWLCPAWRYPWLEERRDSQDDCSVQLQSSSLGRAGVVWQHPTLDFLPWSTLDNHPPNHRYSNCPIRIYHDCSHYWQFVAQSVMVINWSLTQFGQIYL